MKNIEAILKEAGLEVTAEQLAAIDKAVKENYKTVVDDLFRRDYAGEPPLTWTWGYEGITMIFPPETLGPAVMGPVEAFIPFKGNEALFNKKLLK